MQEKAHKTDKNISQNHTQLNDTREQALSDFNCKQNLIEITEVVGIKTEEDASKFIENRAEKIANLINQYF